MKKILAALLCVGVCGAHAETPSFVDGSAADRAAISELVQRGSAKDKEETAAADLDWENAFGIRYKNLAKRDKFYARFVKPQMANLTEDNTLEVKVRFLTPELAVADEYWHIAGQVYGGETTPAPDRWGRTTSIFKKLDGTWTQVLTRVADLRDPYYKHFDEMPSPVHLPEGVLQSFAGKYQRDGKPFATLKVNGDYLEIQTEGAGKLVGIPVSPTKVLAFWPDDEADYRILERAPSENNRVVFHITWADGSHPRDLVQVDP